MSLSSSVVSSTILIIAIVSIIFARRIYASIHGAPLVPIRLAVYSGFVVAIFLLTIAVGTTALPWWSLPIDGAIVVALVFVGVRHTESRVEIDELPNGQWMYRMRPWISVIYLILFIIRLLLDVLVLNLNPLTFSTVPPTLSTTDVVTFLVVDALFAASTGLSIGRSWGIYRRFQRHLASRPPPLPSHP